MLIEWPHIGYTGLEPRKITTWVNEHPPLTLSGKLRAPAIFSTLRKSSSHQEFRLVSIQNCRQLTVREDPHYFGNFLSKSRSRSWSFGWGRARNNLLKQIGALRKNTLDEMRDSISFANVQVMYVDEDFPPTDTSLGKDLAGLVTWRRPRQFPGYFSPSSSTNAAFGGYGTPHPLDVRPCPFALDASLPCAIAAMAERPQLISAALCGRIEGNACGDGRRGNRSSQEERRSSYCRDDSGGGCGYEGGRRVAREEGGADTRKGKKACGKVSVKSEERKIAAPDEQAAAAALSRVATEAGMFIARLCIGGLWKEYIMDDSFPCQVGCTGDEDDRGGPCLSRAHGPALWVSMLEKAYGRAVGSYTTALGGCYRRRSRRMVDTDVFEGEEGKSVAAAVGVVAALPGSIIARPARVLAAFTGAPFLQSVLVGATGRLGVGGGVDGGELEAVIGGEALWGSIVSR